MTVQHQSRRLLFEISSCCLYQFSTKMARSILEHDDNLDELNLVIYGMSRQVYERTDYFHTFDELTFIR